MITTFPATDRDAVVGFLAECADELEPIETEFDEQVLLHVTSCWGCAECLLDGGLFRVARLALNAKSFAYFYS